MADDELVTVVCSDGEDFKVEVRVAKEFGTLKNLIEDTGIDYSIPLKDIQGAVFAKMVEYVKYHLEYGNEENKKEIEKWETYFYNVDDAMIFNIIMASNKLHCQKLLDRTCEHVASIIRSKTPDEIRSRFNIPKDFTNEEETNLEEFRSEDNA